MPAIPTKKGDMSNEHAINWFLRQIIDSGLFLTDSADCYFDLCFPTDTMLLCLKLVMVTHIYDNLTDIIMFSYFQRIILQEILIFIL